VSHSLVILNPSLCRLDSPCVQDAVQARLAACEHPELIAASDGFSGGFCDASRGGPGEGREGFRGCSGKVQGELVIDCA
jgi:hypothetical protein